MGSKGSFDAGADAGAVAGGGVAVAVDQKILEWGEKSTASIRQ